MLSMGKEEQEIKAKALSLIQGLRMQDRGARNRGSEKSRQAAPVAPSHAKRDQTQRKGPRDSCEPPPPPMHLVSLLCLRPHSLPFFVLLPICLFMDSTTFWAPGCTRPTLEEGCCEEDGALLRAADFPSWPKRQPWTQDTTKRGSADDRGTVDESRQEQ